MRYFFTIFIFVLFVSYSYSQDNKTDSLCKLFLLNNESKLTPTQIINNFRHVDEIGWLNDDLFYSPKPFESAYNLNVWDYFKLLIKGDSFDSEITEKNEKYDSELKKEVFRQSKEYKILLDSLKKIKISYLNSIYYKFGFNSFNGESFSGNNSHNSQEPVNYDLQKKGFFISLGDVMPYHCSTTWCPRIIDDVEFKQLPIIKKYFDKHYYKQCLFIPMDMTDALEIENNRTQIEILRVFNITGLYTATFDDTDFLINNHKPCKVKVVKGGSMRLLIYNKVTEKIYFDKLYIAKTKNK